jgi:hypothetical protein
MNDIDLHRMIDKWEPTGCEVVRTIDSDEYTVERIVKFTARHPHLGDTCVLYSLYRYFEIGMDNNLRLEVSVDLDHVDGDRVIQWLAERL